MADVALTEAEAAFARDLINELSALAGTWIWVRNALTWKGHRDPDAKLAALMAKLDPKESADG